MFAADFHRHSPLVENEFRRLFPMDGFMPHGHCYLWTPSLVWTNFVSDLIIGLSYMSISVTLYLLVKKTRLPFSAMFLAFGLFIFACGATHFMEIYNLWIPDYWSAALVKVVTAGASITTAIWLFPVRHKIVELVVRQNIINEQKVKIEQKADEAETYLNSLKSTEAMFRGLLEFAPDGIVVVDSTGTITLVNSQTEKLFGYTKDELMGKAIEILVPKHVVDAHVQYRNGYIANPKTRPMGAGRLLTGRKKDGSELPVEISLSPLETNRGILVMSIVRDITERRRAEESMKATIKDKVNLLVEKEALLKEIHHRVKNNLQVTSSLLRIQSEYVQSERERAIFLECQNRIRSMALIHEKLYRSSDLSKINFFEYVESLAQLLFRSFGMDQEIVSLEIAGQPIFLSIDIAVPCALILNELLSNCLKHAFPDGRLGRISINIQQMDGEFLISVADNGIGLPEHFDFEKTETMGLKLVKTLMKQLNGRLEINTKNGTEFRLLISESKGLSHEKP